MPREKNLEKFRSLLRKGIGTRTQKEFAEKTGISREHLSRLLSGKNIPCPEISTLKILSEHITNVSLNEMLAACGYEEMTKKEMAESLENDICQSLETMFQEEGRVWATVSGLKDTMQTVYLKRGSCRDQYKDEVCPDGLCERAERQLIFSVRLQDGDEFLYTFFALYYSILASGKIVVIDTSFSPAFEGIRDTLIKPQFSSCEKVTDFTVAIRKVELDAPERLLRMLLIAEDYEPMTVAGYGFYCDDIPEGFTDFLRTHAGSFCTTHKNAGLYQRVINGENPEKVFEKYKSSKSGNACGPFAVVADIMNMEFGKECRKMYGNVFHYYAPDTKWACTGCNREANSCIMVPAAKNMQEDVPNDILAYLYCCAKELRLPSFGACYYHTTIPRNTDQVYDTNSFYFSRKNK